MSESAATGVAPLTGIRVIDLSQIGAGPYASSMLGDMGADVVKLEPLGGERFRYTDNLFGWGDSAYFYGVNRSKRSIALDLKNRDGTDTFRRMVSSADVVMVGFRPETVRELHIEYDDLKHLNSGLIYCQITAFGEDGPSADLPGMDILGQALGGLMGLTGEPDGPPMKVGVPIADFLVSFLVGFGICAALRGRELNGVGQKISINLLDGQVSTLANMLTYYDRTRIPVRPQGGGHPQVVPYRPFQGSDEDYFVLACLNDKFWVRLVGVLGSPDLAHDRFALNPDRVTNREEIDQILSRTFRTKPTVEWITILQSAGVPCSNINRLEDIFDDPQILHNESIVWLDHPIHGKYPVSNNPIRMQGTPPVLTGYAPRLGDSREVLIDFGIDEAVVESLVRDGVVFQHEGA